MAVPVYVLCALTSLACAVMLLRAYRDRREPLLLWAGLCFVALVVNNVLLYVDIVVVPEVDLSSWRGLVALSGIGVLTFGLVWGDE